MKKLCAVLIGAVPALAISGFVGAQTVIHQNHMQGPNSQNSIVATPGGTSWTTTGGTSWTTSGGIVTGTGIVSVSSGSVLSTGEPPPPIGALYHQVVDVFYDADGNKIETKSYTHAVGSDCHGGLRRQDQDLLVQDDGKGIVRFVSLYGAGEPRATQPFATAYQILKAQREIAARVASQEVGSPSDIPKLASR